MMFTEEEALALILGLILSRRVGLADSAPAIEGALAKIDRVLPDRLRGRRGAIQVLERGDGLAEGEAPAC